MNTKAENVGKGFSAGDIAKYVLALAIVAAGFAAFYELSWPTPVRGLIVAISLAGGLAVAAFTGKGGQAREFFSEALFELRKVVWPTKNETMRITGVVLLVVAVISLLLAGFDFIISVLIKWLLSH